MSHGEGLRTRSESIPRPGRLIRTLGRVLPGVRESGEQISQFWNEWQEANERVLASDRAFFVALGDSLAQGIGASDRNKGYVSLLEAANPEIGAVNLSKSGARTVDVIVDQLPLLDLLPRRPEFVACTVGSNDLLRSMHHTKTARALQLLIKNLPDNAIMATVPARGSVMAKRLNRVIRSECWARDVSVADVGKALDSWRGRFAADGFHPNDAGHQVWCDAFQAALED